MIRKTLPKCGTPSTRVVDAPIEVAPTDVIEKPSSVPSAMNEASERALRAISGLSFDIGFRCPPVPFGATRWSVCANDARAQDGRRSDETAMAKAEGRAPAKDPGPPRDSR